MLIRNLAGILKGTGFVENNGRRPRLVDADFHRGPLDIAVSDRDGLILEVGRNLTVGSEEALVDGRGRIALPRFIDSHTHAAFAGTRFPEFFRRWSGESYGEITRAGGGIASTQRETSQASDETLVDLVQQRLRQMRHHGVGVVEIKSGYGRTTEEELRLLRLIQQAAAVTPDMRVVATFLALHALPDGRVENEYADEMIRILPVIKAEKLATFVDSFPEKGFFSLETALRFSESARQHGFGVKVHADELTDSGSALAFLQRKAISIDHLQNISAEAIQALGGSRTVATLLPATSFYLGIPYADARRLIAAGARVALATDFNPGTAPSSSVEFTALLAAANLRMTAAEIHCALTYNAACALGVDDRFGSLAEGKSGDLQLIAAPVGVSGRDLGPKILEWAFLGGAAKTLTAPQGQRPKAQRCREAATLG